MMKKVILANSYTLPIIIISAILVTICIVSIILVIRSKRKEESIKKEIEKQEEKPEIKDLKTIVSDGNKMASQEETEKKISPQENKAQNVLPQERKPKEVKVSKYAGKWIITRKSLNEYYLMLFSQTNQLIFTSEAYANIPSAKLGLRSIERCVIQNRINININKNNVYYYRLKDSSNKPLGMSGIYNTKKMCIAGANALKKYTEKSVLTNDVYEDMTYVKYEPQEEVTYSTETNGKWVIRKIENDFYGLLLSSKNVVMTVTEIFASTNSVYNAINTFKKSIIQNNFIIDVDKDGKYSYQLRNNQKSVLCISDLYDSKEECELSITELKKCNNESQIIEEIEE